MKLREHLVLNAYWIPLQLQDSALMAIVVPAAVLRLDPAHHTVAFATLASIVASVAMFAPPIAGAYSDRLRKGGHGRRRFVLAGAAIDVVALALLTRASTIAQVTVLMVVAAIGVGISSTAYQAMLPEVVPRSAWGFSAGIRGAMTLVGTVVGLAIAGLAPTPVAFGATAVAIALGVSSLFGVNERKRAEHDHAHVRNWNDFVRVFIARAFIMFGMSVLMTFILYFFHDVLKVANASAGTSFVAIFALVGAIVSSVVLGHMSDRVKRKHLVAIAGIPMAVAAFGFAAFPSMQAILLFAILFGVGFGGIISVGWALAMDHVPQLGDVARDLGMWGVISQVPSVFAPAFGGWVLAHYAGGLPGYRVLFIVSGLSFVCASLVVLTIGGRRALSPLWTLPLRFAAVGLTWIYVKLAYRVRAWGELPRERGATLLVMSPQHDVDDMAIMAFLQVRRPWRDPIYTLSSRRQFEPGFFAVRTPWLAPLLRRFNPGPLFSALGMNPIENELLARALRNWAWSIQRVHGNVSSGEVFRAKTLEELGIPAQAPLEELQRPRYFEAARTKVKLSAINEPYRSELLTRTRAEIDEDLERVRSLLERGGTVYLAPEGRQSTDGSTSRFKASLALFAPLAQAIYLLPSSFDTLRGRKLSLLFRVVPAGRQDDVETALKGARPVTASQIIATWLLEHPARSFTAEQATRATRAILAALPEGMFVDPDLEKACARTVAETIATMESLGFLQREDGAYVLTEIRRHPRFPLVEDMVAYQARFFRESALAVQARSSKQSVEVTVEDARVK